MDIIELLDELKQAVVERRSRERTSTAVIVKSADGQYRMLGVYSNQFMDREHEIISEAAHEEYATWVKESGFRPVITLMHLPDTPDEPWVKLFNEYGNDATMLNATVRVAYQDFAIGEVERVVPFNGFTAVSAVIYPDKVEVAERLANMPEMGMSHGFISFGKHDNIITKYRSFEMTLLPTNRAANIFTFPVFGRRAKEKDAKMALSEDDRKFLAAAYGEDFVNEIETMTEKARGNLQAILAHKRLAEKEKETTMENEVKDNAQEELEQAEETQPVEEATEKAAEEVTEEPTPEAEAEEPVVEAQPDASALVAEIVKQLDLDGLGAVLTEINQRVEAMETKLADLEQIGAEVKELRKSRDEEIAEAINPAVQWRSLIGMSAPSQSKDNVVPKEKREEPSAPGKKHADSDNPLEFGFYGLDPLFQRGE